MNKQDLTILLALATAAQKGGLIQLEAMEAVGAACRRATQMHGLMGERDLLSIKHPEASATPAESGEMKAHVSPANAPKGRAAKK